MNRLFGLIGYPLAHSFSPSYFSVKFAEAGLTNCTYELIPLPDPVEIPAILRGRYTGLNVTVPYKTEVMQWLNVVDPAAWKIGAVNTLVRVGLNSWKGYNTDAPAFAASLQDWYATEPLPDRALVLGTGGSARAVCFALTKLNIRWCTVSHSGRGNIGYQEVTPEVLREHELIIQCTPLGMGSRAHEFPPIPYTSLNSRHRLYDLVYNPAETVFLQRGSRQGARVKNGLDMLHRQADLAWSIWLSYDPDLSRARHSPDAP